MMLDVKIFHSIVTGSYAYGEPHDNSDLDIAILVTEDFYSVLESFTKQKSLTYANSFRFGSLNLIVYRESVPSEVEKYKLWVKGTRDLINRAESTGEPIDTLNATQHFQDLGIPQSDYMEQTIEDAKNKKKI